ncbi:hypothetical protein [Kribbella shirazensis]|uniref:Uncharacterized protein n=1 Tax=Kribbella shirazensis TaxID=1105143 RepID=A0A7X5V709_9ACTN|nr:hypothetical protein [Kribbella shirazensis]NIK55529.1 hypothetical protein [Kribbella shirazensis]
MTTAVLTPTSFEELLAVSGETARDLAGADQSAWNGLVVASSSAMLGLAHWDGTLYLDQEAILAPLQHMYEHAGASRPTPTLVAYRESLATLLHEHAHFLGPSGVTQEAAREGFVKPGSRELEEGVTEAWAQDHLDAYIHRLGIDEVAPGINSVRSTGYYPALVPAVRDLTAYLETRNDLPPGQVLIDLNRQTAAGQFPMLVDLVYNSTQLPTLEPPDADTHARLESLLRSGLTHLNAYELLAPDLATTKSHAAAKSLLDHVDHELLSAESSHRTITPTPTHTAFAGLAPPTTPSTSPTLTATRTPIHKNIPELTRSPTAVPSRSAGQQEIRSRG